MYLAICSLSVKTDPCPMGALGPRKAGGDGQYEQSGMVGGLDEENSLK